MKKAIFLAVVAGWVIAGAFGEGGGIITRAAEARTVPLPSTLPLLGLGLAALLTSRRKGK